MATVDVECFQDEYYSILELVANSGVPRSPRGQSTRDLGFTTITLRDLTQPVLPLATGRRPGRTVAALEALQLIASESRPDLLRRASSSFEDFMEVDPSTGEPAYFHAPYGRRAGNQLVHAVRKLESDPDTRQAVVTLWDPDLDNQLGRRDYPCTVGFGLSIVHDRLNMYVIMRSNDAWLGLPNDVFQFTQLQWTLAHALSIEIGTYTHTAWSLHLYERDVSRIESVGPARKREYQPTGLVCSSYAVAHGVASRLLDGETLGVNEEGDVYSEHGEDWLRWYVNAVAPVVD